MAINAVAVTPLATKNILKKGRSKASVGLAILLTSLTGCHRDAFVPVTRQSVAISQSNLNMLDSLKKITSNSVGVKKLYKFAADTVRISEETFRDTKGFLENLKQRVEIPFKSTVIDAVDSSLITDNVNTVMNKPMSGRQRINSNVIDKNSIIPQIGEGFFKTESSNEIYVPVEYYGKPIFDLNSDIETKKHHFYQVKAQDVNLSGNFLNIVNALKSITKQTSEDSTLYRYNTDLVRIPAYTIEKPGHLMGYLEEVANNNLPGELCITPRIVYKLPVMDSKSVKIRVLDGLYTDGTSYYLPVESYAKPTVYPKVKGLLDD